MSISIVIVVDAAPCCTTTLDSLQNMFQVQEGDEGPKRTMLLLQKTVLPNVHDMDALLRNVEMQ